MQSLGQVLERFNRKERNLLIRDILGDQEPSRLCLRENFRERVADALDIAPIPSDAWWGTDYHISWLAGAVSYFLKGETAIREIYSNNKFDFVYAKDQKKSRQLVEGNQEDVDLVIATGQDLILIEVKAYSNFTCNQLKSKIDRINLLYRHYKTLRGESDKPIHFHLLLMSPKDPSTTRNKFVLEWAPKLKWIKLELPKDRAILRVARCDNSRSSDKEGAYWHVV